MNKDSDVAQDKLAKACARLSSTVTCLGLLAAYLFFLAQIFHWEYLCGNMAIAVIPATANSFPMILLVGAIEREMEKERL